MRISDWSSDVCSSDLHLVALLLAARKADVHRPLEHVHVELEQSGLLAREFEEVAARQRLLPTRLALGVEAFAQELDVRDAGNLAVRHPRGEAHIMGGLRGEGAGERASSEERRVGEECVRTSRCRWS